LPQPQGSIGYSPENASILVLSPDESRYRKIAAGFRPLGMVSHQITRWAQLTRILRKRVGQHRLAIIDTDLYQLSAVDMTFALRAIDPQLSLLVLGEVPKTSRRRLERQGGILTLRSTPIRPTARLAIGRLLAHHCALEKLRNFDLDAA